MPRLVHRNPAYTHHKASGQAVVTLNGHVVYLGNYGTKASRDAYDRAIGQWLSYGRRLPAKHGDCTIAEIAAAFWVHAQNYYRHPDYVPSGRAAGRLFCGTADRAISGGLRA